MKFIEYYIIISNGNKDTIKKFPYLIKNINEIIILRYFSYETKKNKKRKREKWGKEKNIFFYIFYLFNLIIVFFLKKLI